MAKISLRRTNQLTSPIRLDEDPAIAEIPAQIPRIDLLERSVVGFDGDGNRYFDWKPVASGLTVVGYEQRKVEEHDHRKLMVKVVALWDDERVLDATDLAFSYESVAGDDLVHTVTGYEQNGFRLTLKGHRFL